MSPNGSRTGSPGSLGKERLGTPNSRKTIQWGGSVDFSVGHGDSWSWDLGAQNTGVIYWGVDCASYFGPGIGGTGVGPELLDPLQGRRGGLGTDLCFSTHK